MRAIQVDTRFMPILLVRYLGPVSDEAFERHLRLLETSLYAKDAPLRAVLIDARHAAPPTATQRQLQAQWQRVHAPKLYALTTGVAFVIPSPLIRSLLTAVFWIQSLPCPHEVFASVEDALSWSVSKLAAVGVAYPNHSLVALEGALHRSGTP